MKLTQKDVEHIVADVLVHGLSTAFVAKQFEISQRRVQQLVQYTKKNGQVPWGGSQGVKEGAKKPISPQKAFYRKLTDIIVGNYMRMVEQILVESQEVNK
jgi:transposase